MVTETERPKTEQKTEKSIPEIIDGIRNNLNELERLSQRLEELTQTTGTQQFAENQLRGLLATERLRVLAVVFSSNEVTPVPKGPEPATPLTTRENQVARLIALGYSNREIAEQLFLSIKTTETHRANILHKLGAGDNAGSRVEIVQYALQKGLFDSPYIRQAFSNMLEETLTAFAAVEGRKDNSTPQQQHTLETPKPHRRRTNAEFIKLQSRVLRIMRVVGEGKAISTKRLATMAQINEGQLDEILSAIPELTREIHDGANSVTLPPRVNHEKIIEEAVPVVTTDPIETEEVAPKIVDLKVGQPSHISTARWKGFQRVSADKM